MHWVRNPVPGILSYRDIPKKSVDSIFLEKYHPLQQGEVLAILSPRFTEGLNGEKFP